MTGKNLIVYNALFGSKDSKDSNDRSLFTCAFVFYKQIATHLRCNFIPRNVFLCRIISIIIVLHSAVICQRLVVCNSLLICVKKDKS